MKKYIMLMGAAVLAAFAINTHAATFDLTAQLTGDPRVDNPDNLFVDVTVNVVGTIV